MMLSDVHLTSDVCLSDVCLSVVYIGLKLRIETPRKTKIGTEGSQRHTRLGHHFQGQKVKGQGHRGRGHIVAAYRLQLVIKL